jgi:hypothetical protein
MIIFFCFSRTNTAKVTHRLKRLNLTDANKRDQKHERKKRELKLITFDTVDMNGVPVKWKFISPKPERNVKNFNTNNFPLRSTFSFVPSIKFFQKKTRTRPKLISLSYLTEYATTTTMTRHPNPHGASSPGQTARYVSSSSSCVSCSSSWSEKSNVRVAKVSRSPAHTRDHFTRPYHILTPKAVAPNISHYKRGERESAERSDMMMCPLCQRLLCLSPRKWSQHQCRGESAPTHAHARVIRQSTYHVCLVRRGMWSGNL